ncbi:MAG: hypothetical protein HY902_05365 [Deltaproteobacteria bacterium]|nr:hypothetical protein [Deltaproteobacteria bacterium]
MPVSRPGWALLAAAMLGCASAAGTAEDPLQVEVGGADSGGYGFVDWSKPGVDATIITGPQGGQHIWVSARAKLAGPTALDVAVTMYREATAGQAEALVKPGTVEILRKSESQGAWQVLAGVPAFVKEPCKIRNHRVRVEAVVRTNDGKQAAAKAWITPHYDGYCDP